MEARTHSCTSVLNITITAVFGQVFLGKVGWEGLRLSRKYTDERYSCDRRVPPKLAKSVHARLLYTSAHYDSLM